MKLVIIDYGSGNLRSAAKACERALMDHDIQGEIIVSSDPAMLEAASHIILPGVGAFGDCMQGLRGIDGMVETLTRQVMTEKKWFLGICVGMQLLFDKGFEHGEHQGLGWIPGQVKKFTPTPDLKIPHMGWNKLLINNTKRNPHPACGGGKGGAATTSADATIIPPTPFSHLQSGAYVYFVHSYHAQQVPAQYIAATTDYGGEIVAAVHKENIFGTQFHPEKSQEAGLTLLANFMRLPCLP